MAKINVDMNLKDLEYFKVLYEQNINLKEIIKNISINKIRLEKQIEALTYDNEYLKSQVKEYDCSCCTVTSALYDSEEKNKKLERQVFRQNDEIERLWDMV